MPLKTSSGCWSGTEAIVSLPPAGPSVNAVSRVWGTFHPRWKAGLMWLTQWRNYRAEESIVQQHHMLPLPTEHLGKGPEATGASGGRWRTIHNVAESLPRLSGSCQHNQPGENESARSNWEIISWPWDVLGRELKDSGPRWCFLSCIPIGGWLRLGRERNIRELNNWLIDAIKEQGLFFFLDCGLR